METIIIITEHIGAYGKYWAFTRRDNGKWLAEVDRTSAKNCDYTGYKVFYGSGQFREVGRYSNKDRAMQLAKEAISAGLPGEVKFKLNPMTIKHKLA